MDITEILQLAVDKGASDIFILAGRAVSYKINGQIIIDNPSVITPEQSNLLVRQSYDISKRDISAFLESGDDDFSLSIPKLSRFRISAYKQRGSFSMVIRVVAFEIPDADKLNISQRILNLANVNRGLVLVTGPAGGERVGGAERHKSCMYS